MENTKRIVIIGGVAGGASAAARARRLDERCEIVIIEKGSYVSFANCGLPYHLSGIIPRRENLLVQTPESLHDRFNIDVRVNTEAVSINRKLKIVSFRNTLSGETGSISYDELILSPGAEAVRPPLPGIDLPVVFTLQTIPDMDAIMNHLDQRGVKHAVVVGGGFIGVEVAENLVHRHIPVTLVEADNQILPPLDTEMAEILHSHVLEKGIDLRISTRLAAIESLERGARLVLADGGTIDTDIVIMAIGVRPRVSLAHDAGLETGPLGGIMVDKGMRTSDLAIYAVGDAVGVTNFVTGLPAYVPLAGPANRQGRIAADRIFGRDSLYRGTMGTSICKVFDMAAAAVGATEKLLVKNGTPHLVAYIHAGSHACYYPGAYPLALKIIFEPSSGRILGVQIVGVEGVDKRIDIIATAMYAKLTVFDLEHLELSYAPPFGSAKDPVNLIGFVASNIIRGDHRVIHAREVRDLDVTRDYLLDVRTQVEFAAGHIGGAVNIPVNGLRPRLSELPKDKRIIVYCQVGLRGYVAQRMLTLQGFEAVNLCGGYRTWQMVNRRLSGIGAIPLTETFCNAPGT